MKNLSLKLLEKNLMDSVDADYVIDVPKGLDERTFNNVMRILEAKSLEEVADISNDELIMLLSDDGGKYFDALVFENFFDSCLWRRVSDEKSVTATKRIL